MINFIIRRILTLIPMLLGISLLAFVIMTAAPGDFLNEARAARDVTEETIQQMEKQFGLDQPWYIQYLLWLNNIVTLNFGDSWTYKLPVIELLKDRVPATLILSITSLSIAWLIAVPLGVMAAMYKDSIFDRVSSILAYAAISIPEFFLALLAVVFAAQTGWFPIGGRTSIEHEFMSRPEQFLDYLHHLILPSLVLGLSSVAGLMRIMRANFLDSIRSEYVTTARAKGLKENIIMFRHVLRNAINPLLTAFGFYLASLLSGALLVENVMNYPGLGQLVFQSLLRQDQYVVMAAVLVGASMLVFGNLIADILLAWADPRVRIRKTS